MGRDKLLQRRAVALRHLDLPALQAARSDLESMKEVRPGAVEEIKIVVNAQNKRLRGWEYAPFMLRDISSTSDLGSTFFEIMLN